MIWVISGAGSHVGKTTLANQLSSVLPNSLVIKHGHGEYKSHKPKNFCRTREELDKLIQRFKQNKNHIIVESNSLNSYDIMIFIDDDHIDKRPDAEQLKASANICLEKNIHTPFWRKFLRTKLNSEKLVEEIVSILRRQVEYKING